MYFETFTSTLCSKTKASQVVMLEAQAEAPGKCLRCRVSSRALKCLDPDNSTANSYLKGSLGASFVFGGFSKASRRIWPRNLLDCGFGEELRCIELSEPARTPPRNQALCLHGYLRRRGQTERVTRSAENTKTKNHTCFLG